MMFFHKQLNKGYNLVEVIVYVAIFAIISIVVINGILISMSSFIAARSNRALANAGFDVMERMSREIRGAISVEPTGTTTGSHPGSLVLHTLDEVGDPATVSFNVVSDIVMLSENGVLSGDLFDDDIKVTNLVFTEITTAQGVAVKVELTLEHIASAQSEDFYNTVALRGSY